MKLIKYDEITIENILNFKHFGFDCICDADSKMISLEV